MQNNSQKKFWKWAVILLVALNVFLLTTMWLKQHEKMHNPPKGEKASDFLIEQLKFSDKQMADFEKLKQAHRKSIDSLREAGKNIHRLFFDNLKNEKQDTTTVNKFAREIANNQTQIELVTFNHFEKVRQLCDEKQKQKFDEIIQEVLKRMAAPHDEQGPPPPRDN